MGRFTIWPWEWSRIVREVARNQQMAYTITDGAGERLAVLVSAQAFDRLAKNSGLTTRADDV